MKTRYKVIWCLTVCVVLCAMAVLNTPPACAGTYWPIMEVSDDFDWFPPSLALDPDTGDPRVVYVQQQDSAALLRFAWYEDGEWKGPTTIATIDAHPFLIAVSLALDADGQPGVAYAYKDTVEGDPYFCVDYAYPLSSWSGTWSSQFVAAKEQYEGIPWGIGVSLSCAFTGDDKAAIAFIVSEKHDDGWPDIWHVLYYWLQGGTPQEIDRQLLDMTTPPRWVSTNKVSLAMDFSDNDDPPRIAHHWIGAGNTNEIRYTWRSGSSWPDELAAAGSDPSLVLDPDDSYRPSIAFIDTDGDVTYREKGATSWQEEPVEESGGQYRPSLAIDPNTGQFTVAWCHHTSNGTDWCYVDAKTRAAQDDWDDIGPVSWHSSTTSGKMWLRPSLAIHPISGKPYVAVSSGDDASERVGVAYLGTFLIESASGDLLASLGIHGDLALKGSLTEGRGINITEPHSEKGEFIIMNATGQYPYLALIYEDGDMEIAGDLVEGVTNPSTSGTEGEFVVKDPDGEVICVIDADGNLTLRGVVEGQ